MIPSHREVRKHKCLRGPNSCGSSSTLNSPCVDPDDAQHLPENLSVTPPELPDKVTGTSEPVPATKSGAGSQRQSRWDVYSCIFRHPRRVTEQMEPPRRSAAKG